MALMLDAAGDDRDVTRTHAAFLVSDAKFHGALEHPDDLLVRMFVRGGVGAGFHAPIHQHALLARHDPAADLVADLLVRHPSQLFKPRYHRHCDPPIVDSARVASKRCWKPRVTRRFKIY